MSEALGSLYGAIDSYKRRLVDALRNPGPALEQVVGNANDRARVLNEMTSAAAQRPIGGSADKALAMKLAEGYNPAGITVWHGSPHKFTKFDSSKIGTGEGAQAYGHGMYFAESPDVASSYQRMAGVELKDKAGQKVALHPDVEWVAKELAAAGGDYSKVKKQLEDHGKMYPWPAEVGTRYLNEWQSAGVKPLNLGSLYKVDLPDEHVVKMLDWDKPLSQQTKDVKQVLQKIGVSVDEKQLANFDDSLLAALNDAGPTTLPKQPLNPTGESIYRKFGKPDVAAKAFRDAGIPGIRYLDGGSRGQSKGTSNFVVFPGNEDMLTIQEVNGQPIIDALRKKK